LEKKKGEKHIAALCPKVTVGKRNIQKHDEEKKGFMKSQTKVKEKGKPGKREGNKNKKERSKH